MIKLCVATGNQGKLREIREICVGCEVLPLTDLAVVEDGWTFAANAVKKAQCAALEWGAECPEAYFIGDDSGLEVLPLGGMPGVWSARFTDFDLGADNQMLPRAAMPLADYEGLSRDEANNVYLLKILEERGLFDQFAGEVPAQYRSVVAVCDSRGSVLNIFDGAFPVRVVREQQCEFGFGYDAITLAPGLGHIGLLAPAVKNSISHRGRAVRDLLVWLKVRAGV